MTAARAIARLPAAWLGLALALTAASLWLRLLWVNAISDDGLTLAQAAAISAGQVPYRDFFLASPPGVVALYAAVYKVTPIAYAPARVLTGLSVLVSVAAVWDAGRSVVSARAAAIAAGLYGCLTATLLFYEPHHFWSMTLPYCMAWALVRGTRGRAPAAWAGGAGLLAGLAMLSDQTSVLPLAAGLVAAVRFLGRRPAAAFVLGAGTIAVGTLAWAFATGVFGAMWSDAVLYPATTFRALNPVRTPYLPGWVVDLGPPVYSTLPLEKLVVWLGGFVGGWAICAAAVVAVYRRWEPQLGILVVAAAGLDISVLLARPTGPFLWMCAAINLVLASVLFARHDRFRRALPVIALAALAYCALPIVQAIPAGCGPGGDGSRVAMEAAGGDVCVERADVASLRSAVGFGRRHGDQGVVYLGIVTPAYALAGEAPPVGYVWVAPDVVTPSQLAELESQVTSTGVGWVVSAPRIASAGLHPGSSERTADGRWTLDVYIEDHLDLAGACGGWALYRSRRLGAEEVTPCTSATASR